MSRSNCDRVSVRRGRMAMRRCRGPSIVGATVIILVACGGGNDAPVDSTSIETPISIPPAQTGPSGNDGSDSATLPSEEPPATLPRPATSSNPETLPTELPVPTTISNPETLPTELPVPTSVPSVEDTDGATTTFAE
jgi:hypothetical protein